MNQIPKIAITGGPCAGKSSALAYLYKRLESSGMRPIMVPETATITILAGVHPGIVPAFDFQKGIIELQIFLEEYFEKFALSLPPETRPVLICDRGTLDGKAFCTDRIWKKLLKELGTNDVLLRDARYKAVIHMVTAADGAEEFYTLETNAARKETPSQARASDKKLQKAWLSHPHHRIVGNNGDFSHKISQVGKLILEALGLPEPIESERKFILPLSAEAKLLKSKTQTASVEIEQTYLLSPPGEERRVRRRSQGPFSAYFYCTKKPIPGSVGRRIEQEQIITAQEYGTLLMQANTQLQKVKKTRYCFFYKGQFQELDIYHSPKQKFATLEVETEDKVHFPTFLGRGKEVTGDDSYSNSTLALGTVSP